MPSTHATCTIAHHLRHDTFSAAAPPPMCVYVRVYRGQAAQTKKRRTSQQEKTWQEKLQLSVAPDDEPIRRGQFYFGKWYLSLTRQLLYYCDPTNWSLATMNLVDTKERGHEFLAFAFDLKTHGDTLDKVASYEKKALFESLHDTYIALGSRLAHIDLDSFVPLGQINWEVAGHFLIQRVGSEWRLTCKVLRKTIILGSENIGSDPGPFSMKNNFSLHLAALSSPRDSYVVMYMFPQLSRPLKRRASEELQAVSVIPGLASMASPGDASVGASSESAAANPESVEGTLVRGTTGGIGSPAPSLGASSGAARAHRVACSADGRSSSSRAAIADAEDLDEHVPSPEA